MAIAKPQKFAKDFWPHYRALIITIMIISHLSAFAVTVLVLLLCNVFSTHPVVFVGVLATQVVIGSFVSVIIYRLTTRPVKDLLAAIVHLSGQPTTSTPPNPNENRYAKNGFKDVLQTIYELASNSDHTQQPVIATSSPAIDRTVAVVKPVASFLEAALNETSCGFVVMDHTRTITFSNNAAPVNIGTDGRATMSLLFNGQETLDAWLDDCDKNAVHAERTWSRIPNKLPEEEGRRLFDVIASYDKGTASEVVLTLIDRTSLYEVAEQELDFIAFAAHELRGPITVIRGYLDVLEDELKDVLKDDQHELFHRLTVSANRLSGYINNILNTSRYDRRHLKVHLTETTVANVYDTIRDDMSLRATSQNRLLSVAIPTDLPTIAGDPNSLSEVFANLIDNAIKYSNEGGAIAVTAGVKGELVEISIQDHGIGMPGNVIGNLFQKFYRSHRSRETVAGTGIGLYISKAIVESHGGTIGVRSEDGHGSTFTVSLPTYKMTTDKLQGNSSNEGLIDQSAGWIKNHSMYRG